MSIDPNISLQVLHPAFDTPADALEKNVRIQDIIAQTRQRNREAADFEAKAPLRQLETANKIQALAEENLIKQAKNQSIELDETGHVRYNLPKLNSALTAGQIPNIGSGGYLMSRIEPGLDKEESEHQTTLISDADNFKKRLEQFAAPAAAFIALPDDKKPAAYKPFRSAFLQLNPDPQTAKEMPYEWNPAVLPKLQEIVDRFEATKTEHDKAVAAKEKRDAAKVEAEIAKLKREAKEPILQPIPQGGLLKIDAEGNETRIDPAPQPENLDADERKTRRAEAAYAFKLGKKPEELNPVQRIEAEAWYSKQTPDRATEIDKRIALFDRDPKKYAAIFGRTDVDRPLDDAEVSRVLAQINNDAAQIGIRDPKKLDDYKKGRIAELEAYGVDLKRTQKAVPDAALPKPKAGADTATDATYQAYRKVHGTHEATLKAMKTDGWK